ncbi:hypothetical protein E0W73_03180 [Flavobacterium foetidum]|nr:hypothetical protein E0W73_03180 [Flavobacterium foetidum]
MLNKHLKRLFIIVLSLLILCPSFGSLFIYASFKINQKEIAQTICVQRKAVFNSCNGRCELQKSIKKYSDNERKMQNILKDKLEVVYIQNIQALEFAAIPVIESKKNDFLLFDKKPVGASNLTFHPPVYFV